MLKLLLISVGTLLLFATGAYSQEPHQAPPTEQKSESSQPTEVRRHGTLPEIAVSLGKRGDDQGTEFWPPVFGYRLKVSDTLLVLVTFLLFAATYDLVKSAERTAKRQLRAYLGIENITITQVAVGKKPQAIVEVQNFGQTPAYDVRCWTEAGALSPSAKLKRRMLEPGRRVIDPGGRMLIRSTLDHELTQAELDSIADDTLAILFWGCIRYRDAFRYRRKTEFRAEHGKKVLGTSRLIYSRKGNTAT
jgi:hypothetical protein